jgi:hypothetical protein
VSQQPAEEQGFFKRRVPLRWVVFGGLLLLVVLAAIVVALVLVDRRDDARREAATTDTLGTAAALPLDFTELPADTDLDAVVDASFVSIFIPNESGDPTGYGINSDLPAAKALAEAIKDGEELGPEAAATLTGASDGVSGTGTTVASTITFVFADNSTITFALDLDRGLVARGEQAWQPDGDLRALVEAAVAGGG